MFKVALPILGIKSSVTSEQFYCDKLGFQRIHAYRPDPQRSDPCWLVVRRDGATIVLSSFEPDGPPGARGLQIYIEDAAAVQRELRAAGVDVGDDLMDQTWGNLEFNVRDPDGNQLNFAQDKSE